ncbi:MAG TPA: pyridoxamine 5'-phosphate oxidase family protein [Anaerolineae bacterium]|jgi:PPOX class probable F420-dependent enzyme|nr:pyridoxamine 5'-phosphate oxidase family protein [Anaerolineae bacterium]
MKPDSTAIEIPATHIDLFKRATKAFAMLALTLSDGSPHVTPIWFDWDGTAIIINTARNRVKDKILRKHPKVAVLISAPDDPYRYIHLRGRVVEETEEGGYEEICDLNEKYHGNRNFLKRPGQVRVTYKILPEKIFADT